MNNKSINIEYTDSSVIIHSPPNFSLRDIFDCGQCFRFNKSDIDGNKYVGVARGRYIELEQKDDIVILRNTDKEDFDNYWRDFLDLDFDYNECINSFSFDETLKTAASFANGIRILHQEHWEALCSFIISQNNNIPRIKKIIETLCRELGDPIFTDSSGNTHYSFPSPERILNAGEKRIFDMKTGFRAKYIIDAAQKVVNGTVDLLKLENTDTDEALSELCKICGVGPKVASCVLLFSFRKYDCFPIDVWVKKILAKYYPDFTNKEYFGKYAGIAQQYLFYYERCISGVYLK